MKILIVDSNVVFSKMLAKSLMEKDDYVCIDIINNQTLLKNRLKNNKYNLIISDVFCTCDEESLDLIEDSKIPVMWMTGNTINSSSDWVLSVDDDDIDTMLLERQLRLIPHVKIKRAKDGYKALEILEQCQTLPKFIALDIKMPNMDGVTFTKLIRQSERFKNIPIIVISNFVEDVDDVFMSGIDAIIEKPIDPIYLFDKINKCVVTLRKPRTEEEFLFAAENILKEYHD